MLQIQNGWVDPDTTKIKPYLMVKDSLTLYKGLILKDLHVVVPFLNILHQGHIGIERIKLCAQNTAYWPGISKDITELISNCEICIPFQNAHPAQPLLKFLINHWLKLGLIYFCSIIKIT